MEEKANFLYIQIKFNNISPFIMIKESKYGKAISINIIILLKIGEIYKK